MDEGGRGSLGKAEIEKVIKEWEKTIATKQEKKGELSSEGGFNVKEEANTDRQHQTKSKWGRALDKAVNLDETQKSRIQESVLKEEDVRRSILMQNKAPRKWERP